MDKASYEAQPGEERGANPRAAAVIPPAPVTRTQGRIGHALCGVSTRVSLALIGHSQPFIWNDTVYVAVMIRHRRSTIYLLQEIVDLDSWDEAPVRWATGEMIAAGVASGAIRLVADAEPTGRFS